MLQYKIPNVPMYDATVFVNNSALYLQGAQLYSNPELLKWISDDVFQLTGFANSPCFMDEGGASDYVMQFSRDGGVVSTMMLQNFGTDPTTPWVKQ